MAITYRVSEFAKLARVTVRTLHHYDRIGLLEPAQVSNKGHRLYAEADLVRLQQILTLKWMGFELKQIKALLDDPAYDLRDALRLQQQAIEAQARQLQEASQALSEALRIVEQDGIEELDTQTVQRIIKGVSPDSNTEIMSQFYSQIAEQVILTRRLTMTPDDFRKIEQIWRALYADFSDLQAQGLPPEHDKVQKLAGKMHDLIQQFTGGHADVEAGLQKFHHAADAGTLPENFTGYTRNAFADDALQEFMQAAYEIYTEGE